MAYDAEKNRFAQLLTNGTGIIRERDADLDREADERSLEARMQTGLNVGSEDGPDNIVHPTAEVRAQRLGVSPTGLNTAELAIWKYLVTDPIASLANGLLASAPHRAVLDNATYKYWGFGLYSELPQYETNEFVRRWWGIVWLSNKKIGPLTLATPKQTLTKTIQFRSGTHWGYKFGWDGRIVDAKSVYISGTSSATAAGRGPIPNRSGDWLLVKDGALAGYWVKEFGFITKATAKLT